MSNLCSLICGTENEKFVGFGAEATVGDKTRRRRGIIVKRNSQVNPHFQFITFDKTRGLNFEELISPTPPRKLCTKFKLPKHIKLKSVSVGNGQAVFVGNTTVYLEGKFGRGSYWTGSEGFSGPPVYFRNVVTPASMTPHYQPFFDDIPCSNQDIGIPNFKSSRSQFHIDFKIFS